MSHRVEISKGSQAGCIDKVCKDNGTKIQKGELRFGTWLQLPNIDHGSWKWKHWGCVSGAQIQNIRDKIRLGDGTYRWDAIDGYDDLNGHPELQAKIRRVIQQGHIDAEDFNGDPEYNVLGSRGIRGRAKKSKSNEEGGEEAVEDGVSKSDTPAKKTPAKHGRKKAVDDDDEAADEEPPKKKAKAKKATPKKEKGVKKEEDVDDEPPIKASAKTKKAIAKKVKPEPLEDEDDDHHESPKKGKAGATKRAPRAAAKKSRKKEPEPEPDSEAAPESESELEDLDDADFASELAAEEEDDDGDEHEEVESESEADYRPAKRSRKGKATPAKKAASKGTRKSTRNKR